MAVRRPWLAFAALSFLYFLVSAGTFNALGVVLPAMVGELHWSWKEAGLGYALLGVACGLTSLAAAGSIRRYGVRLTLLAGGAMLAGGFAAMALTHSVWVYLAAASVIGVAFSFCTSVPGTYVLTAIFERRTLERHRPVERVETASEALLVSLNETGQISWPRMESLTGRC